MNIYSSEEFRKIYPESVFQMLIKDLSYDKNLGYLQCMNSKMNSVKKCFINICTKYNGEFRDLVLEEYVRLCKEDELI